MAAGLSMQVADGRERRSPAELGRPLGQLRAIGGQLPKLLPALNARWHLRRATSLGRRVTLRGRPQVVSAGSLVIGNRVRLVSTVATLELVALPGGRLEIGDNVFINYGCSLV